MKIEQVAQEVQHALLKDALSRTQEVVVAQDMDSKKFSIIVLGDGTRKTSTFPEYPSRSAAWGAVERANPSIQRPAAKAKANWEPLRPDTRRETLNRSLRNLGRCVDVNAPEFLIAAALASAVRRFGVWRVAREIVKQAVMGVVFNIRWRLEQCQVES